MSRTHHSLLRLMVGLLLGALAIGIAMPAQAQGSRRRRARRARARTARTLQARARSVQEEGFTLQSLMTPGGMSAAQAAQRAVGSASALRIARAQRGQAQARADQALLRYIPIIDVTGSYTRLSDFDNGDFTSGMTAEEQAALTMGIGSLQDPAARALFGSLFNFQFPIPQDRFGLRVGVTLPLSDYLLTMAPGLTAANHASDGAREQTEAVRAEVSFRAQEAYYQLLGARGALAVSEDALRSSAEHLRQAELMNRVGAASGVDLRRAEAFAAGARVAVAQASGQAAIAERLLRNALHMEASETISFGEDVLREGSQYPGTEEEVIAQALSHRPEIRAVRAMVNARGAAASAAIGQLFPRIAVVGHFDYANPNERSIPALTEWRHSWDLSVVATWSPSGALLNGARHREAQAAEEQARGQLQQAEEAIRLDAIIAFQGYEAARPALAASIERLEAAEAAFRGRLAQYQARAAVTGDLLQANAELSQARLGLLHAAVSLRIAEARLHRATGITLGAQENVHVGTEEELEDEPEAPPAVEAEQPVADADADES